MTRLTRLLDWLRTADRVVISTSMHQPIWERVAAILHRDRCGEVCTGHCMIVADEVMAVVIESGEDVESETEWCAFFGDSPSVPGTYDTHDSEIEAKVSASRFVKGGVAWRTLTFGEWAVTDRVENGVIVEVQR